MSEEVAELCPEPSWHEGNRIAALARYSVVDTPREPTFDKIADLAAALLEAPIAVVNFVGATRQWFKAEVGIGIQELPLDVSICRHAILQPGVLVVPDLAADRRFAKNPLVTAAGGLRFYAGALLETPDGLPIGTVCVLDRRARTEGISDRQRQALKGLADQVMAQLDSRRAAKVANEQARLLEMIASGQPLEDCLGAVTATIGRILPGTKACILVPDPAGRVFEQTFATEVPDTFRGAIFGADIGEFAIGTCGVAVWAGMPVSCPDVSGDGPWAPVWRDLCLAHGFRSVHSEPAIGADGKTLASLALYFGEARELTPVEREGAIFGARIVAIALDRDRAVNALAASEERHRLILNSARDFAIVSLDPSGIITGWNSGAERLMGFTEAEAVGQPGAMFFTAEDRAAGVPDHEMRRAREAGRAENERWHIRKDGSLFWGSGLLAPLQDGHLRGYVKIFADRTLEREAVQRLRASEARQAFRANLAERLRDARFTADILLAASEALGTHLSASVVGYAEPDANGETVVIEQDWCARGAVSVRGIHRLEEYGTAIQADLRAGRIVVVPDVASDQRTEHVSTAYAAYRCRALLQVPLVRAGRPLGILFVLSDVPRAWTTADIELAEEVAERTRAAMERARAEADLRESEARLRLATEAAEVGFWDVDPVNNVLIWPPLLKAMFGMSADASVSMTDFVAGLHPEDGEATVALYAAAADPARRAIYDVEYRTVGKEDGIIRWVAAKGRGVFDETDQCVRVIGTAIDITARKEIEAALGRSRAELQRLNESLEARVREEVSAREAAQTQLAHAQRMEALGQLAGGIAHDINNVLQAVGGGAVLIERGHGDPPTIRRLARMVSEAAERGSAVTRRLLAFSRRGDIRAEAVDPAALLDNMRDILAHTLGAGIGVTIEVAPDLPPILADKGQLETVIVNLAANARDAMEGKGSILLQARVDTDRDARGPGHALEPGTYVRLAVTDSGPGMPPDILARVTEPFFTTKPHGQGTGLGLSMARGFAEQSGGRLIVESEARLGTTVSLWFPIADTAMLPAAGGVSYETEVNEGYRVLLVDDEAVVRQITAEGLEATGFTVITADSGEAAVDLLQAGEDIDLLVTDLSMPGMDGLSLVREAQRQRPRLPAIVLTGFATNAAELALSGEVAGTLSLLRKPVSATGLAERIAVLLASSGSN